ncbi:MAG: cob(I)yrinic acid a,c-diamide adenosyltransferase [Hydrogenothermaceae bacterium]|nr:cob(I)yrinic acid a,c-diamide adenosyltransferase [Hydrogenothermaceae bacterium]
MIYIFTGNGKGKTTAAIGTGIRAVGAGKKVLMIQFMKDKTLSSEANVLDKIENFVLKSFGRRGFYLPKKMLQENPELLKKGVRPLEEEDKNLAKEALKFAKDNLRNFDLIILDEICVAIYFELLEIEEVTDLLSNEGKHFILTGRNCPEKIVDLSDLVTEMVEIKHPYEKGVKAVKGLDF